MQDSENPLQQPERNPKKLAWEDARRLLHYIAAEWLPREADKAEACEALTRRARLLAKPPEDVSAPADVCRALLFTLGDERYAVPADAVRAVTALRQVAPVPCTPGCYLGVVNVRGKVLSALDLRLLFGIPADENWLDAGEPKFQVVVEAAGLEISLVADQVVGVIDIPRSSLSSPSESLVGINPDYIVGATAEGMILLDLEALFSDPRLIVNEEVV